MLAWVYPANSMSSIYTRVLDAHERRLLGDNVDIEIEAHDETNSTVPLRSIIRRFARNANPGIVLMVDHWVLLHELPTLIWIVGVYSLGKLASFGSEVFLHHVSVRIDEKSHHT